MAGGSWDDYFIPGTQVLRNKFVSPGKPFGETDPEVLRQREEGQVGLRMLELAVHPIQGRFEYDHMKAIHRHLFQKAIHRHLFQDVYAWAGQERTAPSTWMTKDGHAYYPAGPALTRAAHAEYAKLADKDLLRGLARRSSPRSSRRTGARSTWCTRSVRATPVRSSCSSTSCAVRLAMGSTFRLSRRGKGCARSSSLPGSTARTRAATTDFECRLPSCRNLMAWFAWTPLSRLTGRTRGLSFVDTGTRQGIQTNRIGSRLLRSVHQGAYHRHQSRDATSQFQHNSPQPQTQ